MYNYYALYEVIQNIIGKINATTRLKFLKKGPAMCPTPWCSPEVSDRYPHCGELVGTPVWPRAPP